MRFSKSILSCKNRDLVLLCTVSSHSIVSVHSSPPCLVRYNCRWNHHRHYALRDRQCEYFITGGLSNRERWRWRLTCSPTTESSSSCRFGHYQNSGETQDPRRSKNEMLKNFFSPPLVLGRAKPRVRRYLFDWSFVRTYICFTRNLFYWTSILLDICSTGCLFKWTFVLLVICLNLHLFNQTFVLPDIYSTRHLLDQTFVQTYISVTLNAHLLYWLFDILVIC